jgi:multidrug resistance efflux pump
MELIITIAYYFLFRLIFIDYKLLKFTMFWQFVVFGLYGLAALTEVVSLGQYAPYSESCYVQAYVIPMAPEYGGLLKKVHVKSNEPVKKGDTLFQMDPSEWQFRVNEMEAKLAAAGTNVAVLSQQVEEARAKLESTTSSLHTAETEYNQVFEVAKEKAAAQITVENYLRKVENLKAQLKANKAALYAAQLAYDSETDGQPTEVAEAIANLEKAKYNLRHSAILAPSNGYVSYLQVHEGNFIRLKTPIMSFVSTDEYWLMTQFTQFGIQNLQAGDTAEVALRMYPGKIFKAVVDEVYWSSGNAQGRISGQLPTENEIHPANTFMVRLSMIEKPGYPIRFGASGIVAVYTKSAADILVFLRQIEIQSESFLNYVYNPFR